MSLATLRRFAARWVLPVGVKELMNRGDRSPSPDDLRLAALCAGNVKFKNRHRGQRCFIVCSGPSVKKQNLLPLKNELTFFVSTGFLHPEYSAIRPAYHCTPGDPNHTPRVIDWYKRLDRSIGDAELFVIGTDEPFIRRNGLFPVRPVNYVDVSGTWDPEQTEIYDLAARVPEIQSVAVMAIMIAMYMGCSTIVLLGVDVDEVWTREYKHYYDDEIFRNNEAVTENGSVTTPTVELLAIYHRLWQQFTHLKRIADTNHVEILNATAGGMLDVYPRTKLDDVLNRTALRFGTEAR